MIDSGVACLLIAHYVLLGLQLNTECITLRLQGTITNDAVVAMDNNEPWMMVCPNYRVSKSNKRPRGAFRLGSGK